MSHLIPDLYDTVKRIEREIEDIKRRLDNIEYEIRSIKASSPSERKQ